jgi:hypothetical protein
MNRQPAPGCDCGRDTCSPGRDSALQRWNRPGPNGARQDLWPNLGTRSAPHRPSPLSCYAPPVRLYGCFR